MADLKVVAQQALEACEQRLPLAGQAAIIDELNNLRDALAQAEPAQRRRTAIDEIHAAWFLAGVGMAGGNWERFFDTLPPHLKQQAEPVQPIDEALDGR